MKTISKLIAACAVWVASAMSANGAVIDGMNWADELASWTGDVQNYGLYASPEMLSPATTWWLTGTPDADRNGNGYGWDTGTDQDSVAGWRSFGDAEFTVEFDLAIEDGDGDDLKIVTYGGPNGQSSIWASATDSDYVQIGTIGGGTAGYFEELWFDFAGNVDDVHYVKIVRETAGPQTGRFFDAVGGVVPEPATLALLGCGAMTLIRRRPRK